MSFQPPVLTPSAAPIRSVLAFALLPVLTAVVGAAIAAFRVPPARVQSVIQHFAAGVVFAVVSVELLPDITRLHTLPSTIVGFTAGVALMLGLQWFTRRLEGPAATGHGPSDTERAGAVHGAASRLPTALLVTVAIDVLLDGVLLGVAFAAGAREGTLLAIALAAELLSLGLAVSAELRDAGVARGRTVVVASGLALLILVGALGGATALRDIGEHTMAGVLSFGCAALLYLVTEELLVEAHEVPETPLSTATFFAGFLLLFMLQLATG